MMPTIERAHRGRVGRLRKAIASVIVVAGLQANAAQQDISGPPGSVAFGSAVAVLPNGDIVVTDPHAPGKVPDVGAVYIYSPAGTLLGTMTGTYGGDHVGSGGITVLANGTFVVSSPDWASYDGTVANAGAVTWVDGLGGLDAEVSKDNSLYGQLSGDHIGGGSAAILALSNGNYVVRSTQYQAAVDRPFAGAVTWGNGFSGTVGPVSAANSLVGSSSHDSVGSVLTLLSNGNYVVGSPNWNVGSSKMVGAVTWANGATGRAGAVSFANSLTGSTAGDEVGQRVVALTNGNYVTSTMNWSNGLQADVGAATWVDGTKDIVDSVSGINSLIGGTAHDYVGIPVALSDGNYVVVSFFWHNGGAANAGAVTWRNGTAAGPGVVSMANSLVGLQAGDELGAYNVYPLPDGSYVVDSPFWSNGDYTAAGAVTWCAGGAASTGYVSSLNSLVGGWTNDRVGYGGVTVLNNGNYVVSSPYWQNDEFVEVGAVTWRPGSMAAPNSISAANSLVGDSVNDRVGGGRVVALTNGRYVAGNPFWHGETGAATLLPGDHAYGGTITAANSLVGSSPGDQAGADVFALDNENYLVSSPHWNGGASSGLGAVTWSDQFGITGAISASNSLVGATAGDLIGQGTGSQPWTTWSDGAYAFASATWNRAGLPAAGAVTLARDQTAIHGVINAYNSVEGMTAGGGSSLVFAYDAARHRIAVGQPASNLVSLFTLPPADRISADGFE